MIALTLRLEDDVHEALRQEAFERRVPLNQIIRERIASGAEPQGEPSDAQVLAALESWYGIHAMWSNSAVEGMRAALRAAGGVR